MHGGSVAELAIFFQFQAIRNILFVFVRRIVSLLAFGASESDDHAHILHLPKNLAAELPVCQPGASPRCFAYALCSIRRSIMSFERIDRATQQTLSQRIHLCQEQVGGGAAAWSMRLPDARVRAGRRSHAVACVRYCASAARLRAVACALRRCVPASSIIMHIRTPVQTHLQHLPGMAAPWRLAVRHAWHRASCRAQQQTELRDLIRVDFSGFATLTERRDLICLQTSEF